MLTTTTHTVEGNPIREYLGFISAEVIVGANFVKDFFASVTDVLGGRSGAYEQSLINGKNLAMQELIDKGERKGANAIVGIDLSYAAVGKGGSMFMINATGTAVILSK